MPEQRYKFQEVQYEFTAHLRDPERNPAPANIEDRRMEVYRGLFYRNIEGFLRRGFPVVKKLYTDKAWHAMVRDFFSCHQSHSPYFRDIVKEFLDYLSDEREPQPEDPVFLVELAHYEWLEVYLNYADAEIDWGHIDQQGNLMQGAPVLSPFIQLHQYNYPVHKISVKHQPTEPAEQPTFLLVYRDQADEVGFMEVNPMTASLVNLIHENQNFTGESLLQNLAAEIPNLTADVVLHGGHKTLVQLREKDILLGTRLAKD